MGEREGPWNALAIGLAIALVAGWVYYGNKVDNLGSQVELLNASVSHWEQDWREIGMNRLSLDQLREARRITVPVLLSRTRKLAERLDQRYARGRAVGRIEMCNRIYGGGLSAIISLEDGSLLTYRDCRFYA